LRVVVVAGIGAWLYENQAPWTGTVGFDVPLGTEKNTMSVGRTGRGAVLGRLGPASGASVG
jgi:hypothetical protein